jgi:hypothetical protein
MMLKIRHINSLNLALLVVWVMLLCNGIFNRHYHVNEEGKTITHAHPVSQSDEDHQHSEEELIFLDLISNPHFQNNYSPVELPTISVSENTPFLREDYSIIFEHLVLGAEHLRGPPALV